MTRPAPSLKILINFWTFRNRKNSDGTDWTAGQCAQAVAEAGFQACTCPANTPGLKKTLIANGLRFAGQFDATRPEHFAPRIRECLAIDNGPINCQLGNHDTPVEEAIDLTVGLMEDAERLGAEVHLEVHRDTCTETPEKTRAIAEGVRRAMGRYPRMNFDFSHPAILKHLNADNYIERLFENIPLFQQSTLWHMRPFNGHHCQVPVTDGQGKFSPEYEEIRPFIRQAVACWLRGPRPNDELWIVPELGPKGGYGLSCFPDIWEDAVVLGKDIQKIWRECVAD